MFSQIGSKLFFFFFRAVKYWCRYFSSVPQYALVTQYFCFKCGVQFKIRHCVLWMCQRTLSMWHIFCFVLLGELRRATDTFCNPGPRDGAPRPARWTCSLSGCLISSGPFLLKITATDRALESAELRKSGGAGKTLGIELAMKAGKCSLEKGLSGECETQTTFSFQEMI